MAVGIDPLGLRELTGGVDVEEPGAAVGPGLVGPAAGPTGVPVGAGTGRGVGDRVVCGRACSPGGATTGVLIPGNDTPPSALRSNAPKAKTRTALRALSPTRTRNARRPDSSTKIAARRKCLGVIMTPPGRSSPKPSPHPTPVETAPQSGNRCPRSKNWSSSPRRTASCVGPLGARALEAGPVRRHCGSDPAKCLGGVHSVGVGVAGADGVGHERVHREDDVGATEQVRAA